MQNQKRFRYLVKSGVVLSACGCAGNKMAKWTHKDRVNNTLLYILMHRFLFWNYILSPQPCLLKMSCPKIPFPYSVVVFFFFNSLIHLHSVK